MTCVVEYIHTEGPPSDWQGQNRVPVSLAELIDLCESDNEEKTYLNKSRPGYLDICSYDLLCPGVQLYCEGILQCVLPIVYAAVRDGHWWLALHFILAQDILDVFVSEQMMRFEQL